MESSLPQWLEEHCQRLLANNEASHDDSPISNLNMNLRRLNYAMIDALVHALSQNSRIQAINLTWSLVDINDCSDRKVVPLADLLGYHPSLEVIHLSYNRLTNAGPLGLALSTNTSLRELHLDHNRLTPESAVAIAQGLSQNSHRTKLAVLCLNSNSIGDIGGAAIASMLQANTSITTLQLANNQLGLTTVNKLWNSLQRNVTLVELGLDTNPGLPNDDTLQVLHLIRANRAGRYLLKQQQRQTPPPPLGLWPWVLTRIEADFIYFFLHEVPTIMTMRATVLQPEIKVHPVIDA